MYNKVETVVFHTSVETITGTKEYNDASKIIDIKEFWKALADPSKFVILVNDVSKWNETISELHYVTSAKIPAPDGYEECYVLSCYTRSTSAVVNRKIKMAFKKTVDGYVLQATSSTT